ncbi:MAG: M14 family zinc carboxypeptidase [Holophaga sp.]|nr:M14 family zinc carboxypeptidase [Holophaga sp.]
MRIALLLAGSLLMGQDWPKTIFEQTEFKQTSTVADVKTFMSALAKHTPGLKPYHPKGAPTTTETGKPLNAWRLAATGRDPLRVYLNGNIHAGEVEGKDALQLVLRELAQGKHPQLRKALEIVTLPTYNADGTDALDPRNRTHQPNPAGGVGPRENAFGLDLNRDMMKAASANVQWLLAMYRDFDPSCIMDLHTTNGSYHGFHITHQASWGTGGDQGLSRFNRRMLVEVQEKLKGQGLPTYDYGNFRMDKDRKPVAWETDFASPNLTSNYPVLEYRLGVLVETYVYLGYPERIEANRKFILEVLAWLAEHKDEVKAQQQAARTRWTEAWKQGAPKLPLKAEPEETEKATIDLVEPLRDENRRYLGEKNRTTLVLPSFVTYKDMDLVGVPTGYLVDPAYARRVRPMLEAHGLKVLPGSARPKGETILNFHETERTISKGAYQGVFTLQLKGSWKQEPLPKRAAYPWTNQDLDQALYVPVNQPLGRLAFYLLDPRSADGLVFWGIFHSSLIRGSGMWGDGPRAPIMAVGASAMEAPAGAPVKGNEKHED